MHNLHRFEYNNSIAIWICIRTSSTALQASLSLSRLDHFLLEETTCNLVTVTHWYSSTSCKAFLYICSVLSRSVQNPFRDRIDSSPMRGCCVGSCSNDEVCAYLEIAKMLQNITNRAQFTLWIRSVTTCFLEVRVACFPRIFTPSVTVTPFWLCLWLYHSVARKGISLPSSSRRRQAIKWCISRQWHITTDVINCVRCLVSNLTVSDRT